MFDPLTIIAVILLYVGCLFLIALWVERSRQGTGWVNNPVTYSLSLAVYSTAWTFYGCVGSAANSGLLFLTWFLGPALSIILWWTVLRKMVRIKNTHHITSIADFISTRYGKSQAVAALATVVALMGIVPYFALQLKAVISTFSIITLHGDIAAPWVQRQVGLIVVVVMIVFTIIIGVRRLAPTERHGGMVMAMAVESLVKLGALLAVGIFITFSVYSGFSDIFQRLSESPFKDLMSVGGKGKTPYLTWASYLLLAMSAIMFLPRQFHIAVVENSSEDHIRTAMWLFPLYMLLINIFIFPIAMGGLLKGLPVQAADTFVLRLPLEYGNPWLTLIVFIGGFSAATGMIMMCAMTLATMVTNHLLLPLLDWTGRLAFLRRHLLHSRWAAVGAIILCGYWFERLAGESNTLAGIGIISFVAVFQFAPVILGGIFWRRGNKAGALLGLSSGFLVWIYTLVIPTFVKAGVLPATLLEAGPWSIELLRPEHLFGLTGFDPVSHTVFWSIFFNAGLYVLGSMCFKQSREEQGLAEEFVGALTAGAVIGRPVRGEALIGLPEKRIEIENLLSQYVSGLEAASLAQECIRAAGIQGKDRINTIELVDLHDAVERRLAGFIGAPAARQAIRRGVVLTPDESRELSEIYAEILTDLKVTPDELRSRIDYYQERESLLTRHAEELEMRVTERTSELRHTNDQLESEIVERKRTEEALSLRSQELARSNAELEQFAYVASHDLQEPLRMVASYLQLLEKRYKDRLDPDACEFIEFAVDGSKRMQVLINDLLAYSRVGTKGRPLKPTDCTQALKAAISNLSVAMESSNAQVTHTSLPTVYGDETQLAQLFQNLIGNAIKFRGEKPPEISISAEPRDDLWYISVKDNGIGIERHHFERIFQVFQRLHSRSAYPGTGIGLAICRKIVERHGGAIWVESEPGQGATFCFTIPRKGGTL